MRTGQVTGEVAFVCLVKHRIVATLAAARGVKPAFLALQRSFAWTPNVQFGREGGLLGLHRSPGGTVGFSV